MKTIQQLVINLSRNTQNSSEENFTEDYKVVNKEKRYYVPRWEYLIL